MLVVHVEFNVKNKYGVESVWTKVVGVFVD